MNKLYQVTFVLAGVFSCHTGFSQSTATEATLASTASPRQPNDIDINSRLYNGPEYIFYEKYYRNNVGHQFFGEYDQKPGEVVYDGRRFTNVPMLYDLHLNQVILTHPSSSLTFRLINEKVQSFTLQGHTFVRLVAPAVPKPVITTGFYDLLFDQGIQVYSRYEKEMKSKAEQNSVHLIFTERASYFAFKNSEYYPINSVNDFIDLFPEKKTDIQKYIRSNKLKFNKSNRSSTLVKLAQHTASASQ